MAFIIDDLIIGLFRTFLMALSFGSQIVSGVIAISTRDEQSMVAVIILILILLYMLWWMPSTLSEYNSFITPLTNT